jgi:hypothetical protein
MIDLAAIQRRIKETVAVLDDFTKRRDPARTRQDYLSLVSAYRVDIVGGMVPAYMRDFGK